MCRTLLLLLFAVITLKAGTANVSPFSSLTVVLDIQDPHYSKFSLKTMQAEAQRILGPAGLALDWRIKQELPPHPEFSNVVVFTMTGTCATDRSAVLLDERGPLALTFTSDGEVLPFGEVRCDRVRASLDRRPAAIIGASGETRLGVALGRVLAHEVYHMLAEEKDHTGSGVTRSSLRSDELAGGSLQLDSSALARIISRQHPNQTAK